MTTLILGAGLTGLSCAWHLQQAGASSEILEAEDHAGGLARSESRDGFTFDLTGHWLHFRNEGIRGMVASLLGPDVLDVRRHAWIYTHGRYIPYPFQSNLWALPPAIRDECVEEFLKERPRDGGRAGEEASSFRDFVLLRFGDGIARHFMLPYNEKLWGVPADALSINGTGKFVPVPDPERIVRGAAGPIAIDHDRPGYNDRFIYPGEGGIAHLVARLAAGLSAPLHLRTRAIAVDPAGRVVTLESGQTVGFDRLVSTLPLPALIRLVADVPPRVAAAAATLRSRAVTCVNVAVRSRDAAPDALRHWVYFPGADFPFYRAGCATDVAPYLAPPGCRTTWAEIAHDPDAPPQRPEDEVLPALRACGILRPADEVLFTFCRTIPHAYVVFDHQHAESRRVALDWLATRNVISTGRYGGWDYGSMEDALLDGKRAAERVRLEAPG